MRIYEQKGADLFTSPVDGKNADMYIRDVQQEPESATLNTVAKAESNQRSHFNLKNASYKIASNIGMNSEQKARLLQSDFPAKKVVIAQETDRKNSAARQVQGGFNYGFEMQSVGANEKLDSERSMNSFQQYRDDQSLNTSVGGTRNIGKLRGDRNRERRLLEEQFKVEGLFRQPSSDEEQNKSQVRSPTKKRMKSKSKASQRKKLLERENEKLKKDLTAMQQQFNDMLMRKVVNTEEGKKQALGKTGKDENLLDDLLTGSKIEEA